MTKEQFIKENAVLRERLENAFKEDLRVRTVLSKLLGSYTNVVEYSSRERKIDVESWEGIAFLIGELKADADYAMVLESREDLKRELSQMNSKLQDALHNNENLCPKK